MGKKTGAVSIVRVRRRLAATQQACSATVARQNDPAGALASNGWRGMMMPSSGVGWIGGQ
ncbi:MAG: hypothetical protein K2P68_10865 [Sphingomonas sp.]|nr:hypothetical protein [Sphingomonas sp.]